MKGIKFVAMLAALGVVSAQSIANEWEKIRQPVPAQQGQTAQSIGSYSNGCIIGAEALPLKGEGYQVIRSLKNRYYGHPNLLNFLTNLGKRAKASGLKPILIGDMGMPAGGRFSSGHASHQTGLDADIWLRFGPMDDQTDANPAGLGLVVVDHAAKRVDERVWQTEHAILIGLAAQDPQVDRIFVNPAIKLKLCQTATGDRSWLRKIRPWYAHDSHFHVRLSCPKGAKYCENQAPVPAGEGCGDELMSWFEPPKPNSSETKSKVLPPLPSQCQMLLSEKAL